MVRKALAMLVVVAVVGVVLGAVGLLRPGAADAHQHSATRSFSATSVAVGDELEVTITANDFGFGGTVTETVPSGFTYESTSLEDYQVDDEANPVIVFFPVDFNRDGDNEYEFTYTVTAIEGGFL